MATLGHQFVIIWKVAGETKRKTFTEEAAALAEAAFKAEQLDAGRTDAANLSVVDRDELMAARELAGAVPVLSALREWQAARALTEGNLLPAAQAWAERHGKGDTGLLVREAVKRYIAARAEAGINVKAGVKRTLQPQRMEAAQTGFVAVLGERRLREVTPDDLARWLGKFSHAVTRNTHRRRLVALFRWCRKRGYLPLDVMTAAERTDVTAEGEAAPVAVESPATLRRAFEIVAEKAPHYLPALAIATLAGLRRIEVHGQRWEDINFERGWLRVTKVKPRTPARRVVPLLPALRAWLEPHAKKAGPVCTNLALDRVRDICRTAGLTLVPNGFRHTWISARVETTGDKARTAIEAGTSVKMIDRHYRELMERAAAEAVMTLGPVVG